MSDRLESILNDVKQYANDAYDDGWAVDTMKAGMHSEKATQIH